jgi:hypothetical protein
MTASFGGQCLKIKITNNRKQNMNFAGCIESFRIGLNPQKNQIIDKF